MIPAKLEATKNLLALALTGVKGLMELRPALEEAQSLVAALLAQPAAPFGSEGVCYLAEDQAARGRILREARANPQALTWATGIGLCLGGEAYLVPGDAYDLDDPGSLVPLKNWPGPLLLDLWVPQDAPLFMDFLAAQGPSVWMARLVERSEDYQKDGLPGRSRWMMALLQALDGEAEALAEGQLTLGSLRAWLESKGLTTEGRGDHLLADFSGGILDPLGLLGAPLVAFGAEADRILRVKEVLTEIKNWQAYTQSQIEWSVNHNLGPYLAPELGRKATGLRKALGLSLGDLKAEGCEILFTGGRYAFRYEAADKKQGRLFESLWLERTWANQPDSLTAMIDALDLDYGALLLGLGGAMSPRALIPGLQAKGWELLRETEDRIEARRGGLELSADPERIRLSGAPLTQLLGGSEGNQGLRELLALL
ncbi:MAG: hypothetical protein RRB13_14540 [bacterium]|nr:hypothetical protein [bacterium]